MIGIKPHDNVLANHLISYFEYSILRNRTVKHPINIDALLNHVKLIEKIKQRFSRSKDRPEKHFPKWETIAQLGWLRNLSQHYTFMGEGVRFLKGYGFLKTFVYVCVYMYVCVCVCACVCACVRTYVHVCKVCKLIFLAKHNLRSDNSAGSGQAISVDSWNLLNKTISKTSGAQLERKKVSSECNCM